VRELSNLLERLSILYPGRTIGAEDLPDRYRGASSSGVYAGLRADGGASPALLEELLQAGETAVLGESCDEDALDAAEEAELVTAVESGVELPEGGIDLKDHLSAIVIRKALEEADGTVAEAARLLRMRRTTLVEKLRKYRLSA
jgi:sigma-54 specific flagellar transcriptional regulator A